MRSIKAGSTNQILDDFFIQDSTATDGSGLAGLAYNTAGLTCYYHRNTDSSMTAVTLATMTLGTFTSSGFKEVDATHAPGLYQFCPPDAALASGAQSVTFFFKGATNMAPTPITVLLTVQDPQATNVPADVQTIKTQTVTCGSSVTVGAFVGNATAAIAIDASGRVDIGKILGTASAGAVGYVGVDWGHVNAPTTVVGLTGTTFATSQVVASVSGAVGSVTGLTASDVGAIKAKTDNLPSSPAAVGSAMTLTSGERDSIAAALLDLANGVETGVTLRQAERLILSALAGKLAISGSTVTIRDVGDSKTRITATVDSDGQRTAVSTDVS